MGKTPEYTKKAVAAYNAKFERLQVNVPKGTKERIQATNESAASLINRLLNDYFASIDKTGKTE